MSSPNGEDFSQSIGDPADVRESGTSTYQAGTVAAGGGHTNTTTNTSGLTSAAFTGTNLYMVDGPNAAETQAIVSNTAILDHARRLRHPERRRQHLQHPQQPRARSRRRVPSRPSLPINCGVLTLSVTETNNGGMGSTTSPLVITRTFTATDAAANAAQAAQTITVVDGVLPAIVAPEPLILAADAGSCSRAATSVALGSPIAGDNCSAVDVGNDAPTSYPAGPTTVTWVATDAVGNVATATQTVTIEDREDPVISAPAAVTLVTPVGSTICSMNVADEMLGAASATDNCPGVRCSPVLLPSWMCDKLIRHYSGQGHRIRDM